MALNDDIRDRQLRHTIGIQRLGSSVVKKIIDLLDKADADLLKRLASRGPTLEGSLSSTRLKYLLQALRDLNHDAHVTVGQTLRSELIDVAKYEVDYQKDLLESEIPVAFEVIKPTASALQAIVTAKPFRGAPLKEVVKGMETAKLQAVSNAIRLGMVEGDTTEQIIRRVRGTKAANFKDGVLNLPRVSAERIVRTAVNDVSNSAREVVYDKNKDLIKGVQWVATLDTRTCVRCGEKDGKVYGLQDGPRPAIHIQCRCTTTPVLKSWRDLGIDADEIPPGTRASMNGQVSATETYQTWLKKQSADVQDEALGPIRGKLFRAGGLKVTQFVDVKGNALTLDQLRAKESGAFNKAGV